MIKGWIEHRDGYSNPFVRATLWIPELGTLATTIDFLIDTGADFACLHPVDAVTKVGMPLEHLTTDRAWEQASSLDGIGGRAKFLQGRAVFGFRHTDGTVEEFEHMLLIMKSEDYNAELPSVLGSDVLAHYELRVSWQTEEVLLLPPDL